MSMARIPTLFAISSKTQFIEKVGKLKKRKLLLLGLKEMGTRRVQKRAFKGRKFGYLKVHRIES